MRRPNSMPVLEVYDTIYTVPALYKQAKRAKTLSHRALLGYIIWNGKTQDPIYGGAYALLLQAEKYKANNTIYEMVSYVDENTKRKIVRIVEQTMKGKFNMYALSERDIKKRIRLL